jgi:molybdopterin converting factor small subunit
MARVSLPLWFKDMTGGARHAEVPGATLEEVISNLDGMFPGIEARIRDGALVSRVLALTVDGRIASQGLATAVGKDSEVCILPVMGGG